MTFSCLQITACCHSYKEEVELVAQALTLHYHVKKTICLQAYPFCKIMLLVVNLTHNLTILCVCHFLLLLLIKKNYVKLQYNMITPNNILLFKFKLIQIRNN